MTYPSKPPRDPSGLLPAFHPADFTGSTRSPYFATLDDLLSIFGGTNARLTPFSSFLDYRQRLHQVDVIQGYQWLAGSLVEDIESRQSRASGDLDLVTYYRVPDSTDEASLFNQYADIFPPDAVRRRRSIYAYFVPRNAMEPPLIERYHDYWHDLWSHTGRGEPKGFVYLDLSPSNDSTLQSQVNDLLEDST